LKYGFYIATLLIGFVSYGQSPYLSVSVKMDSLVNNGTRYKVEMRICELKKSQSIQNWFAHDTSKVNFHSLKSDDIKCGELIETDDELYDYDAFHFGNQVMAFEKILVFKISDISHRNWIKSMYLVMPVTIKSFTTSIQLTDISFTEDHVLFVDATTNRIDGMKLFMEKSLKDQTGVRLKDFPLLKLAK